MRAISVVKALGPIDLRSVRRDALLGWIVAMPLALAALLRLAIPPLTERLLETNGFDLRPLYPLISGFFLVMMVPAILGMVIGFLLLDERDSDTLTALRVTPLTMTQYLAYRIAVPMAASVLLLFVAMPLAGLGMPGWGPLLLVALSAAPLAPLFALFLVAFAENKVQGFALMKAAGMALMLPMVAFFVRPAWQIAFGPLPTYWSLKLYMLLAGNSAIGGASSGAVGEALLYLLGGLAYQSALIMLLLRRFRAVMQR